MPAGNSWFSAGGVSLLLCDNQLTHHASASMVQDVTVVHPRPRSVFEFDRYPNSVVDGHVYCVFPLERKYGDPVVVEDLEVIAVNVKRVGKGAAINEAPNLRLT